MGELIKKESLKEVNSFNKVTHLIGFEEGNSLSKRIRYSASQLTGYKLYLAVVTQESTSNPVPALITNDLGVTITYGRTGIGNYTLTSSSPIFTSDKTVLFIGSANNVIHAFARVDSSNLFITTYTGAGTPLDDTLQQTSIEIRVYP